MKKRTFTTIFTIVSVAAFLPLIFPLYGFANREMPIVLGFPFSFFWVILWVLIVFVAVIVLYFLDPENKQQEGED
ncbi:DUF3311 domain-containing protein [Arthrobacter echini]|uniref:DUF3311 domain-containing protein n=1 Tax=Arthrobacter echini TaxID=1529066 RepID=A0A5D0XQS3_9MICC|nr:DUF3311 domain-containing protein [Arthrobacter echini]TYC98814.1 DUF3311 domain-containing protein [Arthrobacter echini]